VIVDSDVERFMAAVTGEEFVSVPSDGLPF
jgi:hypothetical protein